MPTAPSSSGARDFATAINHWRDIMGSARVLEPGPRHTANLLGLSRDIVVVLLPKDQGEIRAVVRVAGEHRVPLYPVSTGRNWGYGSSVPVRDGCAVVDLSLMTQISDFDPELGLVTVQPGVTQQMLSDFLDLRGAELLTPVTGAGPHASLLGNALERGFGIVPIDDHFASLMRIEAILADGSIYRSAFAELGASDIDRAFKWDVGPYLDGIFTQGNFGIVTEGTIQLRRRPAKVFGIFCALKSDQRFDTVVTTVREVMRDLGTNLGAINLMESRRMLSMVAPYPHDRVSSGQVMDDVLVSALSHVYGLTPWSLVGAVYAEPTVAAAVKREIRRRLRPMAHRLLLLDRSKLDVLKAMLRWLPGKRGHRLRKMGSRLDDALSNFEGRPSTIALPLTSWRHGSDGEVDPVDLPRSAGGLMWYAPIVPMKADATSCLVDYVRRICGQHGMEPLITLSTHGWQCFCATIPILFDRHDPADTARARACRSALLAEGRRHGFLPYRTSVDQMHGLVPDGPRTRLLDGLRQAIDPHGLIAPGRYQH